MEDPAADERGAWHETAVDAQVALLVTVSAAIIGFMISLTGTDQPLEPTTIWVNRWASFQVLAPASASVADPEYIHRSGTMYYLHQRGDPPATLSEQIGRQEARIRSLRAAALALDQPPLQSHVAHDEAKLYVTNAAAAAEQTVTELRRVMAARGLDAPPVELVDPLMPGRDRWDMDAGLIWEAQ